MKDNWSSMMASRAKVTRTNFSERKIFRSSIHVRIGGSRSRSIDEGSGAVEFHVDPNTKELVNTALNPTVKEKSPEFVIKPRRQFINEGETAKFKVSFEGSPTTELTWSVNGKTVVKDDRHKIYKEKDCHMLEIPKVKAADQGMYVCKIENSGGSATAEAELEIFVRPKPHSNKASKFLAPTVDVPLEDTELVDKQKDVSLVCKFHNGVDGKATWFKDGRELGSWQAKTTFDGRTAKLVLREASKKVCGVYECIVKNTGGEAKTRAFISLLDAKVKPVPPKFTISLSDQTVDAGEKLVLETRVEGKPRPSLKWYKDNEELGSSQDIRMEYKDGKGRLIVDNLKHDEASKFTCVAQNVAGEAQTESSISVADDSREPPIFTKELHDMEVSDGDRVEMSVEVKGTPPTDIVWVHNNREIPPTDPVCRMVVEGNVHTLIIPEVFPEDSGEYVCEAYNDYGDTDTFCRLTVHEEKDKDTPNNDDNAISHKPPGFTIRPQKLHVTTGTSAILKCSVSGDPPPSVQWLKGVLTIKHGSKYKITSVGEEHCLEITSTVAEDTGQYTCTLCNLAGTTIATTFVTVGEVTPSASVTSEFRSVLRNRSHYSHGEKSKSFELENSDVLSVDSEPQILRTTVKTSKSVPQHFRNTVHTSVGEPSKSVPQHFRNTVHTSVGEPSKSVPQHFRNTVNTSVGEPVNLKTTITTSRSEPESFKTTIKASKSGPENFTNVLKTKSASLTIEKKVGVSQVDFRGVLKNRNTQSEPLDDRGANGHSNKLVKESDLKKSGSKGSSELRNVLSQKRQIFEVENTITRKDSVPKSVPNAKPGVKLSGGKISQALQKFENIETAPKTDFRSVLKHRKEIDTSLTDRSVVRVRKSEELKKFRVPETKMSHSETSIEIKPEIIPEIGIKPEIGKQPEIGIKPEQEFGIKLESGIKPEFKIKLDNQSVTYGSEVVMECKVSGRPEPDVSWSINDKEIKQSKYFQMSYENSIARLVIAEVFSEDEGEYTCKACNSEGKSAISCSLHVQERAKTPENTELEEDTNDEPFSPTATPPKIYNISPSEFCILRGGAIEFKASYTSVPTGTVTWSKNKQEIKSANRMTIDTSEHFSTLTITDIQPCDSGRFDIKVENALGSDISYASLSVQDVPEPPVGQPWVSEVTLKAVTLSWYGPAYDGGCPITNYRVEMCDAEDQEWIPITSTCVDTTYRITNLAPHTPYFFRIFAENKHGISTPCQTSDVTVTSDRRPSALQRLPSTESDDVFTHETNDFTPTREYDIVSPLSPDEIPFEHRECLGRPGREFDHYYKLMQEVGKGKFGSVYKCEEKSTGKIWAAKILKCRDSEKKKIHLEVDVMNQLKHPKILMLWDVFDVPRKIILVMEYIGGGELFERVIDDDFELTERDCIQFMRQILDAVHYMHNKNILHLDLKPENILCVKNESNKIKIIDFGLARFYKPGESTRVLFGTPEFIAPEVVNYDEIGFTTDMWSIGVICYVLLTGLSPFMGDSDAETLSNVTQGEFDFEDETFDMVSEDGKHFIECLLVKNKGKRMTAIQALEHRWLAQDAAHMKNRRINTKNLKRFMLRRKWQKTGNAIRALGRMTSLQKLITRKSSANESSATNSGSQSSSTRSSLSSSGSQSASDAQNVLNPLKVSETEEIAGLTNQNDGKSNPTNEINGRISKTVISEDKADNIVSDKQTKDINSNNKSFKNISLNSAPVKRSENRENNEYPTNQNSENKDESVRTANSCNDCASASQPPNHHGDNHNNNHSRSKSSKSIHPVFTKEMIDSKAFPGDAVRFDVEFNTDIAVTWYFEDDILYEDPRHCIQNTNTGTCSLIIKDVCEDDDGEYSCKIVNNIGEETCSAELIVYGAI